MKRYPTPTQQTDILEEPLAAYASANYFAMASRPISKTYIKKILTTSKISLTELIEIIPISMDTYKRKSVFGAHVTEKVLEIEQVYRRGLDVFGEGFYQWMDTNNIGLGNIPPKRLLGNSFGVRRLLDQIGRIEHGVLA